MKNFLRNFEEFSSIALDNAREWIKILFSTHQMRVLTKNGLPNRQIIEWDSCADVWKGVLQR
jgi:hypothetical protein